MLRVLNEVKTRSSNRDLPKKFSVTNFMCLFFPRSVSSVQPLQKLLTLLTVGLKISRDADFEWKRNFFLRLSKLPVSYSNLTSINCNTISYWWLQSVMNLLQRLIGRSTINIVVALFKLVIWHEVYAFIVYHAIRCYESDVSLNM